MTDLLGEQLLTDVNARSKMTLLDASRSRLGVWQTWLLYIGLSRPASSPMMTRALRFSSPIAGRMKQTKSKRNIARIV